jgi:Tol biopolymer transport system component
VRAWESTANASDIWIHGASASGTKRRLTFDPADETGPIWKPVGSEVTYLSRKAGNLDILSQPLDGGNEAATLVATPLNEFADDWSHDGKYLVYTSAGDETHADLWYLRPAENGAGHEPVPLLRTPARELVAKFSRDGRYLAYCSNESGRYEVYVQSFPSGNQRWQVSFDGGTQPRWSRDGKELFFVNGDELIAVSVRTNGAFAAGRPTPLFRDGNLQNGFPIPTYDVSADGQRFVMVETLGGHQGQRGAIQVSQNWFAGFRDRGARRD